MCYAVVDGIRLFFRAIRNGVEAESIRKECPTMLVLHGGPGIVDHQIEFDAWKRFSATHQVVFLDQRGCGRSEDGDPKDWNLIRCGRDIKEFCDALGILHPVVAGVSWGGYVAMSYATQFPSHPAGLILTNTEAKVDLEAKKSAYALAIKELGVVGSSPYNELGEDETTVAERVGEIACEYDRHPSSENFDLFVKFCVPLSSRSSFELKPPHRVNMAMREKFIGSESLDMDFTTELSKVGCPVLQLAGERDPTHPAICAERTAACFPRSKYVLFSDAGAPVYQDQDALFSETVNDFLTGINHELKVEEDCGRAP